MITRRVGELEIPALGLGTWPMKGEECAAAVANGVSMGYRHVDTAAYYGNEEAVGAGLRSGSARREDVFLTTKVWHDNLAAEALLESAAESLKRLGTDYVDLLLVHWPTRDVPLEETVAGLLQARQRGYTRAIGVSNFPSDLLREAQSLAGGTLVTNQVEYHPFLSQKTLLKAVDELKITLTAYQPIAGGAVFENETIREIAAMHGRTPVQITLRWLLQQDQVIAIPKSSDPTRLLANRDVFDFSLTEDEMGAISALGSPLGRRVNMSWAPDWDPE